MTRFLDDFRLIGCWALVAYWSRPHYKYYDDFGHSAS